MPADAFVFLFSCGITFVASTVLIMAERFGDGVVIKIGLAACALAAASVLANSLDGVIVEPLTESLLLGVGIAAITARRVVSLMLYRRGRYERRR